MNYYPHHLGDYAKDTGSLSMMEHGAYRLLLDAYYSSEKPIPREEIYRVTKAQSRAEREAVDYVVKKFFTLQGDCYLQSRVEREISILDKARRLAQENGKKGGRPPKEKPSGFSVETQRVSCGLAPGFENETHEKPSGKAPQEPKPQTPNPKGFSETERIPLTELAEDAKGLPTGSVLASPPVTLEQAKQFAVSAGVKPEAAEMWWLDRDGLGWTEKGHPIRNWRSNLTAYGRRWAANEHKNRRGKELPESETHFNHLAPDLF